MVHTIWFVCFVLGKRFMKKVRVWETDTLHGDSPFTEQPGQCGEEGDYIQVNIFPCTNICFEMFDFRARCQKTFWQMKTLQLCLALVSYSSGLVSGDFGFKKK